MTDFSGIYKILNLCTGKFYIGSAVNIRSRFKEHILKLNSNRHVNHKLQDAWNFFEEDAFDFIVIDICPVDQLLVKEQYWLDSLKAVDDGYNIARMAGSTIGYRHTEEYKQNRSKLYSGRKMPEETKLKISLALKGKKKSPEFSKKLSANKLGNKNMIGKQHSEEAKNKMRLKRKETVDRQRKADTVFALMQTEISWRR